MQRRDSIVPLLDSEDALREPDASPEVLPCAVGPLSQRARI